MLRLLSLLSILPARFFCSHRNLLLAGGAFCIGTLPDIQTVRGSCSSCGKRSLTITP